MPGNEQMIFSDARWRNAAAFVIGKSMETRAENPEREGSRQITPFVSEFPYANSSFP